MSNRDVFINCPFTPDFTDFFNAIVFTIIRSGFNPRCALEADDGSENRFEKICQIVGQCDYGVHDISKTELDAHSALPRFNMPLELGLFLAAKKFGDKNQKRKKCIIFDRVPYRYQQFISDIAGQDIYGHKSSVPVLIGLLSGWLRREKKDSVVPGGNAILKDFKRFQKELPSLCKAIKLKPKEMTFQDYRRMIERWIVI